MRACGRCCLITWAAARAADWASVRPPLQTGSSSCCGAAVLGVASCTLSAADRTCAGAGKGCGSAAPDDNGGCGWPRDSLAARAAANRSAAVAAVVMGPGSACRCCCCIGCVDRHAPPSGRPRVSGGPCWLLRMWPAGAELAAELPVGGLPQVGASNWLLRGPAAGAEFAAGLPAGSLPQTAAFAGLGWLLRRPPVGAGPAAGLLVADLPQAAASAGPRLLLRGPAACMELAAGGLPVGGLPQAAASEPRLGPRPLTPAGGSLCGNGKGRCAAPPALRSCCHSCCGGAAVVPLPAPEGALLRSCCDGAAVSLLGLKYSASGDGDVCPLPKAAMTSVRDDGASGTARQGRYSGVHHAAASCSQVQTRCSLIFGGVAWRMCGPTFVH